MGNLIAIVGNSGIGKTTLVQVLCKHSQFATALEEHDERPFQRLFKDDKRYAFANQVDYLLFRAQQERILRQSPKTGLMDGGLEMDFYGFTRLFHVNGWLTDAEFVLCKRLYDLVRTHQPPPDLFIHLTANPEVIVQRLATRKRINIADAVDIPRLDSLLNEWLSTLDPDHLLCLDVSGYDIDYQQLLPSLMKQIKPFFR